MTSGEKEFTCYMFVISAAMGKTCQTVGLAALRPIALRSGMKKGNIPY